ncbi:hypothetical protein Tco_0618434 [Tanacetum coccineum]
MSEAEPIPPTSSVTALRIPMIKKGEYDLWMKSYVLSLLNKHLCLQLMMRDLLQIDEDAMEEIDIRWQVAIITARIRKFMRKTGRPIDLKPKNGITFDKSKIECFNYSNSKALVATDNNEEIDWTKEFDAEPVTFAMMALTELEEDDWSMEIDAEPVHFGQDGLGDFDWSNKADDTPVSLALMATNSEVPYCSKCSKSYKQLLENYQTEKDNFQKARSSTTRTPHRPQRPKKIMKSIWVKKESTVGSQAVLPQNETRQLSDFKEFKGGYVAFGNDPKGGRITGKGTIKTSCIDFEKVSYVEELKFNLLSVSQICDKKHNVLLL